MQSRRAILIVFAVIVAGGTFQLVRMMAAPAPAPRAGDAAPMAAQPVAPRVLVAATDLPAGRLVQAEDLRWQAWPADGLDDRFVREGVRKPEDFAGAVVRTGVVAGEPVTDGRLVKPGERGFMAAVLSPEMRAVTVPINAVTGIAGFIFPGDRVDVILTHSWERQNDAQQRQRRASETVLTNVRVLALDQRVGDQEKDTPAPASTATLEVWPEQAESLPLLVDLGQLSLSLRSLSAAEDAAPPPTDAKGRRRLERPRTPTWDSDVSTALPNPTNIRNVQILRGSKGEEVTFGKVN